FRSARHDPGALELALQPEVAQLLHRLAHRPAGEVRHRDLVAAGAAGLDRLLNRWLEPLALPEGLDRGLGGVWLAAKLGDVSALGALRCQALILEGALRYPAENRCGDRATRVVHHGLVDHDRDGDLWVAGRHEAYERRDVLLERVAASRRVCLLS